MNKTYRYYVEGSDAANKPWRVTGYVDALPGDIFGKVWQVIGAEVVTKMRQGMAVYGNPELMCKGPFRVTEMHIKERTDWESDKGLTE